jgi:hypothetical protein
MVLLCPNNSGKFFKECMDLMNDGIDEFILCSKCPYVKKQHIGYKSNIQIININSTSNNDLYKILNTSCKLPENYINKCIELSGNNIGNAKILAKTIEQLLINDSEKIDKLLEKINVGDNLWDIDKYLPENEKSLLYLAVLAHYNL